MKRKSVDLGCGRVITNTSHVVEQAKIPTIYTRVNSTWSKHSDTQSLPYKKFLRNGGDAGRKRIRERRAIVVDPLARPEPLARRRAQRDVAGFGFLRAGRRGKQAAASNPKVSHQAADFFSAGRAAGKAGGSLKPESLAPSNCESERICSTALSGLEPPIIAFISSVLPLAVTETTPYPLGHKAI